MNTFLLHQSSTCKNKQKKTVEASGRLIFGFIGEEELKTGKFRGYQFSSDKQISTTQCKIH